ncbi:uncharacterized protein AB675_6007 [Cyphellophora attinorum]|uniref:Uncharacterized protein n=1 Tax=Cyphellophora attinorum TaxID=1664694 RepID=A0A0N1H5G9_9EURO|nr:uncharacterized protein AB675_6007 [Phialophora attinorum]KPI37005.1 hypothetical protein AB675_6007 [Phialophora attinorum]
MTSHEGSHSELFGLKGQDESGIASKVGKTQDPPKEGQGVLGGAGHPTGAESGGSGASAPGQNAPKEESTVGGMAEGSSDSAVPGSGGSALKPSQGTGTVGKDA